MFFDGFDRNHGYFLRVELFNRGVQDVFISNGGEYRAIGPGVGTGGYGD